MLPHTSTCVACVSRLVHVVRHALVLASIHGPMMIVPMCVMATDHPSFLRGLVGLMGLFVRVLMLAARHGSIRDALDPGHLALTSRLFLAFFLLDLVLVRLAHCYLLDLAAALRLTLYAMATACFTGLPAPTSRRMFDLNALSVTDRISGMDNPLN